MKKFYTYILLMCLCQIVFPQSNGFWKGDFINSSESFDFRVLINNSLYKIIDKSWIEDIEIPDGEYRAIDVDRNTNIWLFTSSNINIWDRDESKWISISSPPTSILFGKVFDNYVYCGNSINIYRADYTQSVIAWELVYEGDLYEDFYVHENKIYVAKYLFEVIRSVIGSQSWESILTTPTSPAKVVVNDGLISVGTFWDGVFSSVDSGYTWVNGEGMPGGGAEDLIIRNENEIYALAKDQHSTKGWFYSNNSGISFTKLSIDLSPWAINQMRGLQIRHNEIFINVGYRGFYKSNNNGESWEEINNGYNNNKPHHIKKIINTKNDKLLVLSSIGGVPLPWYVGTWGIFMSADNGESWEEISHNLHPDYMIIEDIIETGTGDIIAAPYDPGHLFILKEDSNEWVKINVSENLIQGTFEGSTIEVLEKGTGETVYAGTFWDGLLKSGDNGKTWEVLDYGVGNRGVQYIYTIEEEICIVSNDQAGYVGIFYSADLGTTWQQINDNGIEFKGIKKFDSTLFAYTRTSIYKSQDIGITWEEITENLPFEIEINSIDFASINLETKSQSNDAEGTLIIASNLGAYMRQLKYVGWGKISDIEINCVYYSETSKQIHFGGIESFFSKYYNESAPVTPIYTTDKNLFNAFYCVESVSIVVENLSKTQHIKSINLYNSLGQKLMGQNAVDYCRLNMNSMGSDLYIIYVKYFGGQLYAKKLMVIK